MTGGQLETVNDRTGDRRALSELREQGFTVVRGGCPPAVAAHIDDVIVRLASEEQQAPRGSFEGHASIRILNLLAKDDAFLALPTQPDVLRLVEQLLGSSCLVSSVASLYVAPGTPAQPLHSDDQAIRVRRDPLFPTVATAIWAIGECGRTNGSTRLVRNSHRFPTARHWGAATPVPDEDIVVAELDPGDILLYDGAMHHGAGANTTASFRRAVGVGYCAGFIRQAENQMLGIPAARVAKFPSRLQELVGYATCDGILGHIDRRSPAELLS